MELRTTPEQYGNRDHELFPALALARHRYGVPSAYEIEVTPTAVMLTVGDFYLEESMRLRLAHLYEAYLTWWCDWPNPHVEVARALGMPGYLSAFRVGRAFILRGEVLLIVLPEHAQWWIDLLNETAPFLEERARLFPNRTDEEEQARWEYESLEHAASPARMSH